MNQKDIDLVQELEAEEAARAEAVRMEENARLNPQGREGSRRPKWTPFGHALEATVKYGPRKKREPS